MVSIQLKDDTAEKLRQLANARGLSVEECIDALADTAAASMNGRHDDAGSDARLQDMIEWMRDWGLRNLPPGHVIDDSRDSIYEGRGE